MKKILVVDDDADILDMMQLILKGEGYEVQTSLNGACFQQMYGELPDLIILDILLSGADGRGICQQEKSRVEGRHVPVVLFAAHVSARDMTEAIGADAFLANP